MTKLSDKTKKVLSKIEPKLPPRGMLLSILNDSLRLLTGIACGMIDSQTLKTQKKIHEIVSTFRTINDIIEDNPKLKLEMDKEADDMMDHFHNNMDVGALEELVKLFNEDRKKDGKEGIGESMLDVMKGEA